MKTRLAAAAILLAGTSAFAHRLDEYLQGAMISVEKDRLQVQLTLAPGVAVLPIVLAEIGTAAGGQISPTEQRAYAARVLRDLSLAIDGHRLTPRLLSVESSSIEELKDGRGEIRLEFIAELPRGGPTRRLVFENQHQSRIAAYQVNALVPRDPAIRIVAQKRNYSQSRYELEYAQAGVGSGVLSLAWWTGARGWLGMAALVLFARFALLWRQRAGTVHVGPVTSWTRHLWR